MARREVTGRKPGVTADLIKRDSGLDKDEDEESEPAEDERDSGPPEPDDDEPTQPDQPAAQAFATLPPIRGPPPRMAFNIPEFCEAFRISEDFYYKLKRQGLGPREMKIGTRTLISLRAADEWRRAFEARTEAAAEI